MSIDQSSVIMPIADLAGELADHVALDDNHSPYLIGGECTSCEIRFFPLRPFCPKCTSEKVARVELPRTGTLYTYCTVRISATREVPYHLGYIDLPGNVRLLSTLRGNENEFQLDDELQLGSVDGDWFFSKTGE